MKKLVLLATLWALLIIPMYSGKAGAVDGAVIAYGLDAISEVGLKRILDADCMKYICVQHIHGRNWDSRLAHKRAEMLRKANKRIVLQIWWGPCGDFPWAKYGFPNIALDESARADFFKDVVDTCIEGFGAQNLYGVHLLEETGMQFGTDVGPRENPDDFLTFKEHSDSYGVPWYSGWGNPKVGGVHIANVRRHEKDFTRMTGLKFADESAWGASERYLFDRWVSTRLQSLAQVEFARYIHGKYPGLKAFTWDLINSAGENPRTDHHLEAKYFDGVIADPYGGTTFNFSWQRAYRTLYPNAEIINFSMGGMAGTTAYPQVPLDTKRSRTICAYLAGADVIGFFENPQDFDNPASWKINTEIMSKLKLLPRFKKKSSVLLISDGLSDVYASYMAWTGLKYCDFLPTWEAHGLDFSRYQVVILHSSGGDSLTYWNSPEMKRRYGLPGYIDCSRLDRFVAGGGVLILSGRLRIDADCPLFVAKRGYLHTTEPAGGRQMLVVTPTGWLKEKAGLKRDYRFSVTRRPVVYDPKRVASTSAGYFFRYGKGSVLFFPFFRFYDPKEPYTSKQWRDYRQMLSDVTRGVLRYCGKASVADEYIDNPDAGNYYMQALSDDKRVAGYMLPDNWLGMMNRTNWRINGRDLLSGAVDPPLCKSNTALLISPRDAAGK
ncbi:MAG: hypothetical protein Q7T82_10390 [Armatimonadota bacterium]|nr:hypothetical protein [Armatimonadota bacterium]